MKPIAIALSLCMILIACGSVAPSPQNASSSPSWPTMPPEFLEDCTIQNIEISSRAIFNNTIGIRDSIKLSLGASEDDQNQAILGFERSIMKIEQVWIPACMESMKSQTVRGIEKTIEGLRLYYAGSISESVIAFRDGSSQITDGSWQIAVLNLCIQSGFDENCYLLMKRFD